MTRPTMQGIRAAKGRRPLVQMNVDGPDQARAARSAGIDIIVNGAAARWPAIRAAAPDTPLCLSLRYGDQAGPTEVRRAAFDAPGQGAVSICCPLSPAMIEPLAREGIPVCAHAGQVPQKTRMTGLRAFGKTAEEAKALFHRIRDFESAGAAMVGLELVAAPVAPLLTPRTSMSTLSNGSGGGCDVTCVFGVDILNEAPPPSAPRPRPRRLRGRGSAAARAPRRSLCRLPQGSGHRPFPGPDRNRRRAARRGAGLHRLA